MPTGALICEYNPFHNGHKYMLDQMRKDGCDAIVAVMSGSFTQRGDVAVFSKFARAKQALLNGADIIIELPAVRAVSSAQRFAEGGCEIIKALSCVDRVYFGSECGDIEMLKSAANATLDQKVNELVENHMSQGDYYPTALQKAVEKTYGKEISDILSSPNNTLGIEYIKALVGSGIEARTITRTGVEHDSNTTTDTIASASKIRELICKNIDFNSFVPMDLTNQNPAFSEQAERAILMKLRTINAETLRDVPDVTEGLENRICDAAKKFNSTEDILTAVKTKRYTMSRLRRILTCALLGIKKEHLEAGVPYIRVLGFNYRGEQLLKEIYKCSKLPLVLNVSKDIEKLTAKAKDILDIDINATDIRTVFETSPSPCGQDYTMGIIKI